jgi:glycine/D-amino acid oxidase-like deaminating enzyme
MHRRHFLRGAGAALAVVSSGALAAESSRKTTPLAVPEPPPLAPHFAEPQPLAPIRATPDRIVALSVCTRPFRAQGPRIEVVRIGRKQVVHNYGHGGSGWSLSWGSAELAVGLAQAAGARDELAVIGCGAIGLTTALVAQRAGLRVRIYAKERPPEVRSFFATGVWSPDSRICTAEHATPEFKKRWEQMARSDRMARRLRAVGGTVRSTGRRRRGRSRTAISASGTRTAG